MLEKLSNVPVLKYFFKISRVETFFKILGIFFYYLAGLALATSIIFALVSLNQFLDSPDDDFKLKSLTLSEYEDILKKEDKEAKEQKKQAEEQKKQAENNKTVGQREKQDQSNKTSESKPKEKELTAEDLLKLKICSDIDQYAALTVQNSMRCEYLDEVTSQYETTFNKEIKNEFLNRLSIETGRLLKKAPKIAKESKGSYLHIQWDKFLIEFRENFEKNLEIEQNRIRKEVQKSRVANSKALDSFMIVGIAFGVFIFFSLLLLLVKIEENTRPKIISPTPINEE